MGIIWCFCLDSRGVKIYSLIGGGGGFYPSNKESGGIICFFGASDETGH